jgi:hypothetical protein
MLKLFSVIMVIGASIVSAGNNTLLLPLKDTVSFNNDSILWITFPAPPQAELFRHGELQVELPMNDSMVTLRDTSYRFLCPANPQHDMLTVIIFPYILMNRYFSEMVANSHRLIPVQAGPKEVALIKRQGTKWRLVKTKQ